MRTFLLSLLVLAPLACTKSADKEKEKGDTPQKEAAVTSESKKGEAKGGGKGRGGPVPVRVALVQSKEAPRNVTAVAPLAGRIQVDVFSKVTGRITYMGPKEGQAVKAGEVLFRVDRSDPGESYLTVPVISPLSGWLGRWRVINMGEQVTAADPVVTVVDDRALKVVVFLPAGDWLEVTPNTAVTAQVNDQTRPAKIETIARSADLSSGRGSVTLVIDNPQRDWRSGMYARLTFAVAPKPRILVNAASLVVTDSGAYVYVLDSDNNAKRIPVKYQMMDSDTVEITEGLKSETKVVTAGGNMLGNNSKVRVID